MIGWWVSLEDLRLRLIEVLWDSLSDEAPLEITDEVRAELDRRLAEHRRDPGATLSWDEIKRRVRGNE